MPNRSVYLGAALIFLMSFGAFAQTSGQKESKLSASQQKIVKDKIATLKIPQERQLAESWSDAKKAAEMLCRPAALPVLKKQTPSIDKVFLGTDDPKTLNLESNRKLTGSGQFRTANGWQDFTFTCELDPATGKVTSFKPVVSPK